MKVLAVFLSLTFSFYARTEKLPESNGQQFIILASQSFSNYDDEFLLISRPVDKDGLRKLWIAIGEFKSTVDLTRKVRSGMYYPSFDDAGEPYYFEAEEADLSKNTWRGNVCKSEGCLYRNTQVKIKEVLYSKSLEKAETAPENVKYLLLSLDGDNYPSYFMVHEMSSIKDFFQVWLVNPFTNVPTTPYRRLTISNQKKHIKFPPSQTTQVLHEGTDDESGKLFRIDFFRHLYFEDLANADPKARLSR